MCDSGVILKGEIRCWSLLRVKGLNVKSLVGYHVPFSHNLMIDLSVILQGEIGC